jgi:hypothetical protein
MRILLRRKKSKLLKFSILQFTIPNQFLIFPPEADPSPKDNFKNKKIIFENSNCLPKADPPSEGKLFVLRRRILL